MVPLTRAQRIRSPVPPSSPTSPSTSSRSQGLLVASSFDTQLRRAGLDIIKCLSRRPRTSFTQRINLDSKDLPSRRPRVELHILLLAPSDSIGSDTPARSIVLQLFREAGAIVHVHHVPFTPNRLSLSLATSSLRSSLLRAMQSGPLDELLREGVDAVAFVSADVVGRLGGQLSEGEQKEASRAFVEGMAIRLAASSSLAGNVGKRSVPSITMYLPHHPHQGDFDFDLPADDVRAVQLAHEAATQFASALTSYHASLDPTSLDDRRRTSEYPAPTPPSLNPRRHTYILPRPLRTPSRPPLRPLLLRPAPGSGPQSIIVRLPLLNTSPTGAKDVVLRIVEAQTPLATPTDSTPHLLPLPPTPPRPPQPKLRLAIPSSSPPSFPALLPSSQFSPSTPSPASALTPEESPFDSKRYSPLCKLGRWKSRKGDQMSREEELSSAVSLLESATGSEEWSPRWREVRGLLWMRRGGRGSG